MYYQPLSTSTSTSIAADETNAFSGGSMILAGVVALFLVVGILLYSASSQPEAATYNPLQTTEGGFPERSYDNEYSSEEVVTPGIEHPPSPFIFPYQNTYHYPYQPPIRRPYNFPYPSEQQIYPQSRPYIQP